jgi:hypothetical protein
MNKSLLLLLWIAGGVFIYLGFYDVDPFYFSGGSRRGLRIILYSVRVLFPALWIGIMAFVLFRKPSRAALLTVAISTVFSGVAGYIVILHFYYVFSPAHSLEAYHPYLQLSPPTLEEKPFTSERRPIRILFLGGSSTDWPDSTGTEWTSYVEKKFAHATDVEVQSYNTAREWYNVQHSLINYVVNARQLKPTHVVIMNVINDFMVNAEFSWISTGAFQPDYRHWLGPVARLIKRPSLYGAVGEKLSAAWYAKERELVELGPLPGLEVYRQKLTSLVEMIKNDGAVPVLMTEPYLYRNDLTQSEQETLTMLRTTSIGASKNWSLAAAVDGMARFTSVVKEVATSARVPLIDLEAAIPKEGAYLRDDCHYTDKAFPVIADVIAAQLQTILMVKENR